MIEMNGKTPTVSRSNNFLFQEPIIRNVQLQSVLSPSFQSEGREPVKARTESFSAQNLLDGTLNHHQPRLNNVSLEDLVFNINRSRAMNRATLGNQMTLLMLNKQQ